MEMREIYGRNYDPEKYGFTPGQSYKQLYGPAAEQALLQRTDYA